MPAGQAHTMHIPGVCLTGGGGGGIGLYYARMSVSKRKEMGSFSASSE